MKRFFVLTLSILLIVAITLSGCGSSAQKYFKYDLDKYITVPGYETTIDSSTSSFKAYYDEVLYQYLSYKVDSGVVIDGDIANINYIGYVNGTAFEGGTANDYNLQIGSGTFIDGFESQLIGAKTGETKEIEVTFPADYSSSELRGKDATFKVTINYITRISELNDENAQKAGLKNALELADMADRNAIVSTAWDTLIKDMKIIKYPKKEMKSQLNDTLASYNTALAAESLTLEDYAKQNNMTVKELKEYIEKNEVGGMIATYLAYYGILQKAGYELSAEDIEKAREYIKQQSEKNNFDFSAYSEMYIEAYAAYTAASNVLFENAKVK